MHATARSVNVIRRLNAWALALAVTGAPRVLLIGDTVSKVGPDASMRLTLTPVTAYYAGRYGDSAAAYATSALLVADLFFPTGETALRDLYAVVAAADDVKSAATRMALTFLDYSADPDAPTTVDDAFIQCLSVPEVRDFPRADGFVRRQVIIPLVWHQADNDA